MATEEEVEATKVEEEEEVVDVEGKFSAPGHLLVDTKYRMRSGKCSHLCWFLSQSFSALVLGQPDPKGT